MIQHASMVIQRATANQARLIDDLLDISRIVSGKLVLDIHAVDLAAVAEAAVEVARGAAAAKKLELAFEARGALGMVRGDPARLQQVVANLLGNAIKFTPVGGKVTAVLEAVEGGLLLAVTDTGIGIDAADLSRLFDRFVQVEGSSTRTHGGLGLGLAIVRYLVEVHGGQVWAESPGKGRGAVFRVMLPLAIEEPDVSSTGVAAPQAESVAAVRVLLIEDDEDTRETFAMMLAQLGADVRSVSSAAEGLETVERVRPQAILCDIAMPEEDGYAFIRRLRAQGPERGGATPAAALTAFAGEEDRRRALEAGFQMHLAKPIDASRLAAAVGALARWPC